MRKTVWRRLGRGLSTVRTVAVASLRAFLRSGGPTQAASLAFYALLSTIPLFFLMLSLYGFVAGDTWAAQVLLRHQLASITPFVDAVLINRARRLVWASPSLTWESLGFILTSSWIFVGALRQTLRQPWVEPDTPSASWPQRLAGLAWRPVAGALFVVAVTVVLFGAHVPRLSPPGSLLRRFSALWGMVCLAGLFFAVYLLFLPGRRPVRVLAGLAAALAAAAYAVSSLFVLIVADLPRYHLVYGSLSGAVLFLLWLDYNLCLLLWGAWFVRIWQHDHAGAPGRRRFALGDWLRRLRPGGGKSIPVADHGTYRA